MKCARFGALLLFALATVASVVAQVPPPKDPEAVLSKSYTGKSYSPYAERGFPSRPFWGDTHLHTDISMDAGAFGNRLGLDDGTDSLTESLIGDSDTHRITNRRIELQ